MGFGSRLWDAGAGVVGGVREMGGFFVDLATAPFNDEADYNGAWNTVRSRFLTRGAMTLANTMGPDTGLGALVGGLPTGVREAGNTLFEGIEYAGREWIREPLTTMMIAGSLSDSDTHRQTQGGLFDADTWRLANSLAQETSLGQAVTNAFMTKDLLDRDELLDAEGSDHYNMISGTIDFGMRLFFDADIMVGRVGKAARLTTVDRVIEPGLAVRRFIGEPGSRVAGKFEKHADEVLDIIADSKSREGIGQVGAGQSLTLASARIAKFFPKDMATDAKGHLADWLAMAEDVEDIRSIYLVGTGNLAAMDGLHPALRTRMADYLAQNGSRRMRTGDTYVDAENTVDVFTRSQDELEGLSGWYLDNLEEGGGLHGTMLEVQSSLLGKKAPGAGIMDAVTGTSRATLRDQRKWGRVDQATPMSPMIVHYNSVTETASAMVPNVVRGAMAKTAEKANSVRRMLPHSEIRLADPNITTQVERMLDSAWTGLDDAYIADVTARIAGAPHAERHAILLTAQNDAMASIMKRHGVENKAVIDRVIEYGTRSQQRASRFKEQRFAAGKGPDGRANDTVRISEGSVLTGVPISAAQALGTFATPRFREMDAMLAKFKKRGWLDILNDAVDPKSGKLDAAKNVVGAKGGKRNTARLGKDNFNYLSQHMLNQMSHYWKTGVLLRPAWTVRVVLMDEQLRFIAKFGALTRGRMMAETMADRIPDGAQEWMKAKGFDRETLEALAEGGGLSGGLAGNALRLTDGGFGDLTLNNGLKIQHALGSTKADKDMWSDFLSASLKDTRGATHAEQAQMMKKSGRFVTIRRVENPEHYDATWASIWNDQIRNDKIADRILEAMVVAGDDFVEQRDFIAHTITQWIGGTSEGAAAWKLIPLAGRFDSLLAQEDHVNRVMRVIEQYSAGRPEVWASARDGRANIGLLDDVHLDDMPEIHGEWVSEMLGQSPVKKKIEDFIEKAFNTLGTMPSDKLSRQPAFRAFYERSMRKKVEQADLNNIDITQSQLTAWENASRKEALVNVKDLMYDLAEQSEFAEMNNLIMPFYGAWQEVITRWAGLAYENPDRVARLSKVFQVETEDMYIDPETGEAYYNWRIPEWAKSIVNKTPLIGGALDEKGTLRINRDNLNMVMQGGPGFGPFVQTPMSAIARERPEAEEALEFLFPFGPPENFRDSFKPSILTRSASAIGAEDRAFASSYSQILSTRLVMMEEGLIDPVNLNDPSDRAAFLEDIKGRTKAMSWLRAIVGFVGPTMPSFHSPYTTHIEQYRAMRREDPKGADARFIAEFGEEFFALTQSVTRNNNGVPATQEGWIAEQKYQDLLEDNPEMGSIILGSEGGGANVKFSRAMYDRQLGTPIRAGSNVMQRERLSPEEQVESPDIRLGWRKYVSAMDQIEAARIDMGLPNFRVKGAEQLATMRRMYIERLAEEHPAWYAQFSITDRNRQAKRIEGMTKIAADSRLSQRDDIAGLRKYLEAREQIIQVLNARVAAGGSSSLDSTGNADVAEFWDTYVGGLVESSLAFGELYYRWLDNDRIAAGA